MSITVRYFGEITDITNCDSEIIPVCPSTSILIEALKKKYPRLATKNFAVAVEDKICNNDTNLEAGSTVVLLPPFSGG